MLLVSLGFLGSAAMLQLIFERTGAPPMMVAIPYVSDYIRQRVQPGDLVAFYSPISHVGLYIGGGSMIDASHPGSSGAVAVRPVNWGSYAGAGRP